MGTIQLSNDVTVALFLNLSLQNFEVFLKMISSTSVQNFNRRKCSILPWQHILWRVLRQNWVLEISDDIIADFNLNKIFTFVCNTKKHLCTKFVQNQKRNKKVAKMGNDVMLTVYQISNWLKVRLKNSRKCYQTPPPSLPPPPRLWMTKKPGQDRANNFADCLYSMIAKFMMWKTNQGFYSVQFLELFLNWPFYCST